MKNLSNGKLAFIILMLVLIIDTIYYINQYGFPYQYPMADCGLNGLFVGLICIPTLIIAFFVIVIYYIVFNWE